MHRKTRSQPVSADRESLEPETTSHDSASMASTSPATTSYESASPALSCSSPAMSDQELIYEIFDYILENMEPNGADISHFYEVATKQPPITPESLAELDMPRIINNPKLRHDVNFDRELHFRPNLEGSKGKQKLRSADQYWQALEGELFMYGFAAVRKQTAAYPAAQAHWERVLRGTQRRLRQIFEAIRDILSTLVPDHEQKRIRARLDVDLIMQQITNGVCDLIDLSTWLATVVKKHCAPMRDELVDAMSMDIQRGALENRHDKLVNGLRQLLNILEAMKLDVANHQIRHMRPLLVDDTVNFQRRYNAHRISLGKIEVRKCQKWFDEEMEGLTARAIELGTPQPTTLDALSSALLRDLLFNEATPCPPSFYLDYDRLRIIRNDIRSTVSHEICRATLAELTPPWVSPAELLKAQGALQCAVSAIVGMSSRFTERVENIAVEIVRFLLVLEGRYPPFDGTLLGMVEQRLAQALQPTSQAFDKLARDTCDRLLPKLKVCVDAHIRMSALDLQDALVSTIMPALSPSPFGFGAVLTPPAGMVKQYDPDEDIVRRMTHIICLHWQVWADLVYLAPKVGEADTSASASLTPSPTIPIAQAVYAPGKKWLPVSVTVTDVPSGMPTPASTPKPAADADIPRGTEGADPEAGDATQQESESLDAHQHPTT
ncbi:Protein SOSEKI 1 [Recurvomyces mirabilis]|uniref:Protein SOSEKI 1 n=1 Tax=Recurvomyces mirabilis TaxID=574656 RepID=A0AAE1C0B6_9PEZI|nr:Protein SOSEKI 1 [Recurvomyces mirabilis]KAK5152279.1 Protein SOSEKI 1 [Recurvomyces mirabilis]